MWPFKQKQTSTFTDQVVAQGVQQATAVANEHPAAMPACANLHGTRLVQCTYEGPPVISKEHLLNIGRDVVMLGHARLVIVGDSNDYKLIRPIHADKLSKGGWQVTIREGFADRNLKILDAEIINFVFNQDPFYPWRGKPLWQSSTSRLAINLDKVMSDEASSAAGKFIWINGAMAVDEDARRKEMIKLKYIFDFTGANRGKFKGILNPSPRTKEQPDKTVRIGPDWSDALEKTRAQLFNEICAACNVPPQLVLGGAGATIREGNRQFGIVMQTICDLLSQVFTDGLNEKIELTAKPLHKIDLVSRARSVGSLVTAGVPVNTALEMCGFDK